MISPEGKEIILTMLGPGAFFGEMALLDDEPRSATVVATEALEVVTIWRSDLRRGCSRGRAMIGWS